jgi:hypothetical protein
VTAEERRVEKIEGAVRAPGPLGPLEIERLDAGEILRLCERIDLGEVAIRPATPAERERYAAKRREREEAQRRLGIRPAREIINQVRREGGKE